MEENCCPNCKQEIDKNKLSYCDKETLSDKRFIDANITCENCGEIIEMRMCRHCKKRSLSVPFRMVPCKGMTFSEKPERE